MSGRSTAPRAGDALRERVASFGRDLALEVRIRALLVAVAHEIQEEIPRGEGTDVDVQRITDLWKWTLSPFLRPCYVREHLAATAEELRGPFEFLVHSLAELAFHELGYTGITAPPFGGRSTSAWFADLRRRREGMLSAQSLSEQRSGTMAEESAGP